jgi:hypothetical protein
LKPVEIDVRLLPHSSVFFHSALAVPAPTLALPALLVLLGACRGHASAEDCHAAAEHYLDLAVRESPGAARLSPAQAAAVKDVERGLKRAEPAFRRMQDSCESVGRAEAACAAKAETTAAWEGCLRARDGG